MNMRRLLVPFLALALCSWFGDQLRADVFQVRVVDSQTGRGVPLVEMTPLGGPTFVTDSNGIIAVDDPSLLNRILPLGFRSYGYSEWGGTVQTTSIAGT
jgi:hypothetical protein